MADKSDNQIFRLNGISYLEIPSRDLKQSISFYRNVFSWNIREDPKNPSFEDGTGHAIGHWNTEIKVAGWAGIIPYVYVERVDDLLEKIKAQGGTVVKEPYAEGNLRVAMFQDPSGNVLGIWQRDLD